MIRVLVAEDSPTARALLVQILAGDPEIQVVGEARNGREAVELTQRLRPDLVTMDVHMPLLDGLSATKEIMIVAPTPIVIVTGSTRAREVGESLETLRVGALEVLAKPPGPGSPGFAAAARELLATVKAMSQVKVVRHWRAGGAPAGREPAEPAKRSKPRVVAVASSTGGPAALRRLLGDLSTGFPLPILIVQHITPGFTEGLAGWLAASTAFRVKVAEEGEPLAPGIAYLAPDERHLGVSRTGAAALSDAPPVGGFRPSGTYLFESVARQYGASTLAVILTGMGDDGLAGLRAVKQAGGRIIAQDESTSVVFGMPGAAIAEGLPEAALPIEAIGPRLASSV